MRIAIAATTRDDGGKISRRGARAECYLVYDETGTLCDVIENLFTAALTVGAQRGNELRSTDWHGMLVPNGMDGVGGLWQDGCVSFRSHHPGGAHFVLVDGSVHFLSETIDARTFGYLGARNDGEVVGAY